MIRVDSSANNALTTRFTFHDFNKAIALTTAHELVRTGSLVGFALVETQLWGQATLEN